MHLGFALPVSGSWATVDNIAEIAERAESAGYHSLWTFQRLLSAVDDEGDATLSPQYRSVLDPLAVLSYVASITTRARLGVAVLNLPFSSPIVTAKSLSTIDLLSQGRLEVGFGTGWQAEEFAAVDMSMERRGARADDFLRCLTTIWAGGVVEYHGEFYDVPRSRVAPLPVQSPHPPVLLGGSAAAALRRAGRLSDGWISSSQADLSRIEDSIGIVRAGAVEAGRDPDALRFVCRGVLKIRTDERAPLVGGPDEIRGDLADLASKGVTETFIDLNFDPTIGSPDADAVESMRRAREILEMFAPG